MPLRRDERERWGDPIAWAMYDRLGPRYPLTILMLDLATLYLVFGVGVTLLPVWIGMSVGRFVTVLVAAPDVAVLLSVTCQLSVRVWSVPLEVMLLPLVEKVIESSAAW